MSSEEHVPDLIAAMDQARKAVGEQAKLMRSYHASLVAEGFSEEQALALTLSFQVTLMTGFQQT